MNHQGARVTRSFVATERFVEAVRKRDAEFIPKYLVGRFNRARIIEVFKKWCEQFRPGRSELPRRAESRRRTFNLN